MNNREEFKKWLLSNMGERSNAGPSYLTSLEWLSDKFYEKEKIKTKSIYDIESIDLINILYTEVLQIQKDKSSYIFNNNAPGYGNKGFFSASLAKYKDFLEQKIILDTRKFKISTFNGLLSISGLHYNSELISRFTASIITKPFVILTGLSGSGKTKIAQSFVKWICSEPNQYRIIPVGADWTNREPLLGYPNALQPNEYIIPENGALDLLVKAKDNPDLPYFLILDEMNLSHVERYFADFLSVMESDDTIKLYKGTSRLSSDERKIPQEISWPKNLFTIGTVNIDETTHMFSPKVLDRANTIEFRVTVEEMISFLDQVGEIKMETLESKGSAMAKSFLEMALDTSVPSEGMEDVKTELAKFFVELKKAGAEFGYRSATEILKLIDRLGKIDPNLKEDQKLDIAIIQKLLPKLHGSRRKLVPVLTTLANLCLKDSIKPEKEGASIETKVFNSEAIRFTLSHEKLSRMYKAAIENGFASFAEA